AIQRRRAQPHERAGQQHSLAQQIADEIGRAIVEWRLRPGDDLNSVELERRFPTSRSPVLGALLKLEQDGLVEIPPRRRPRVAAISLDEVRGIYRVRATLNALLAETLAEHPTPEISQGLRQHLETMPQAAETNAIDAYLWASVAF